MEKDLLNVLIFIVTCIVIYIIFRNFNVNNFTKNREGLTTTTSSTTTASASNGIAGNATAFAAAIQSSTVALQNQLLVTTYRTEYETVILNLDDYLNNLMLSTVLSIDVSSGSSAFATLTALNSSRQALNTVMKFIDSS